MREEIGKRNQMTALRFQTGEGHHTSLASLQGSFVGEVQLTMQIKKLKEEDKKKEK